MDRVRALLPVLKKHHFWALSAVVVVAAVAGWWKGSEGLKAEYEIAVGDLQSRFTSVEAIGRRPNHPNQTFITAVNDQHNSLKVEVYKAWLILHADQQKILVWPDGFSSVAELAPDEEIPERMRERFLNYYKDVFPELFETVHPLKTVEDIDEEEPAEAFEGLVAWDEGQRNGIRDAYAWNVSLPTTKAIRFAQEDYWVYKALLTIIDRANAGATANYNAAVKTINNLQIAQAAKRPKTTLMFTGDTEAPQAAGTRTSSFQAPAGLSADDLALEEGRYVDAKGIPLSSASAGPFAEFKLMPVLIDVVMDQRKIPLLLAECANSALPVEVRQMRINPGSGGPGKGPRGGGGGGGGMGRNLGLGAVLPAPSVQPTLQQVAYFYQGGLSSKAPRGGRQNRAAPARQGGGMGQNAGGGAGGRAQAVKSDYDVNVEIWGLIYIFERPDATKLGIDEALAAESEIAKPAIQTEPADVGGQDRVSGNEAAATGGNDATEAGNGLPAGDGATD